MGDPINWGQKRYGPQAKGIQIGPRVSKGGGMPNPGKLMSDALNAVGRFARDTTANRERVMRPSATVAKSRPASRRNTSKYR